MVQRLNLDDDYIVVEPNDGRRAIILPYNVANRVFQALQGFKSTKLRYGQWFIKSVYVEQYEVTDGGVLDIWYTVRFNGLRDYLRVCHYRNLTPEVDYDVEKNIYNFSDVILNYIQGEWSWSTVLIYKELGKDTSYYLIRFNWVYYRVEKVKLDDLVADNLFRYYVSHGTTKREIYQFNNSYDIHTPLMFMKTRSSHLQLLVRCDDYYNLTVMMKEDEIYNIFEHILHSKIIF